MNRPAQSFRDLIVWQKAPAVERWLACEAVVNKENRIPGLFRNPRSVALREGSTPLHNAVT